MGCASRCWPPRRRAAGGGGERRDRLLVDPDDYDAFVAALRTLVLDAICAAAMGAAAVARCHALLLDGG